MAISLGTLAVWISLTSLQQIKPPAAVVAVFSIEDTRSSDPLSEEVLSELTNYLSVRLAEGGLYRLTPSSQVRQALADKKAESFKVCYDESCQIELGKAVAAEKSLGTKILQIDSRSCAVTSTLYDLKTEVTERAATAEGGCDRDSVARSLRSAVTKLRGEAVTPEAVPASAKLETKLPVVHTSPPRGPCKTFEIRDPRDPGANIRSAPRVRPRTIIAELKNGTLVTKLAERGQWAKVRVDATGLTGFVHKSRLVKACP